MARETLEYALASVTDALEEVADDHLCANNGKHQDINAETAVGHLDNGNIVSKQMRERIGEKFTHDEAGDNHDLSTNDGEP